MFVDEMYEEINGNQQKVRLIKRITGTRADWQEKTDSK